MLCATIISGVRRSIIGGRGGTYSYIRVLHKQLLLKSFVSTVFEHEYMNKCPTPNYRAPYATAAHPESAKCRNAR